MRQAVEPFCGPAGALGTPVIDEEQRERAVREFSRLFDVNPVVARLRLEQMFPSPKGDQLWL